MKLRSVHKGEVIEAALAKNSYDFILCIGDDYTDEDMFKALPSNTYSIKVGHEDTDAKYQIDSVEEVLRLLKLLANS